MLLLLILVHILSPDSAASPVPRFPQPRTDDTCNDINNCRTLSGIIWGCLATIFACTWVSVHPNVPAPNQSALTLLLRKLKMMFIGIIAPEIMVGFAARQFFSAWRLSKEFELSKTHGFFFTMGGFVSSRGCVLCARKELEDPELLKAIRSVEAEDITDKSKGDALSKGVALVQGLWFTTQCLVRIQQTLLVTQLEIATMAFVLMNVFIWILWWNKPLEVQRQIVVMPTPQQSDNSQRDTPTLNSCRAMFASLVQVIFGEFPTEDDDRLDVRASVPDFWSLPKDSLRGLSAGVFPVATGLLFGAVHCAAWNTQFATPLEMWIWRVCSVIIVAAPPIWALHLQVLFSKVVIRHSNFVMLLLVWRYWTFILVPVYISARLFLVALPLAQLRSLPSSAYMDINWSTYIPHI